MNSSSNQSLSALPVTFDDKIAYLELQMNHLAALVQKSEIQDQGAANEVPQLKLKIKELEIENAKKDYRIQILIRTIQELESSRS